MFLDHVGVVIAHLREAVEFVFGGGVFPGLENEPHLGAFEQRRREIRARAGDVSQRLLLLGRIRSRVSSQSVCGSPGLTEKVKSSISRMGQSGSFTWMLSGKYSPCVGFDAQRGKINGDAVEAGVHVLPAVGERVVVGHLAKIRGDQDVYQGRPACRGLFAACAERRRGARPSSYARRVGSGHR